MSSGGDNSVKQWIFDADDGTARLLRFRSGHAAPPVVVRFYGESGTRFLSAGADRAFRVFSTIQDQQSRELSQRNVAHRAKKLRIAEEELKLPPVVGVASCQLRERDWCNVVTAHAGAPSAYTWRLADGALGEHVLTPPRSSGATVTAVAISACGHYALLGSAAGDVDRFNLQSGIHRGGFVRRAGDDAAARAVTDGGARAAASSNVAAPATMLDLGATSAGDATDRDRVAAQPPAQVVKPGKPPPFWALAGPRRETDAGAPAHGGAVTLVDADACNARVISAGLDGQLCVWSFRARRLLHTLPVGGIPERGATHRSAALLALACTDRSARVFDIGASPPRRVRTFAAHGDALTDLTFSDDARWLLTACLDGATRVWDVPAGRLLQSLRLGGAPVTALALSPDMDTLTTAHAGKRCARVRAHVGRWRCVNLASGAPVNPIVRATWPTGRAALRAVFQTGRTARRTQFRCGRAGVSLTAPVRRVPMPRRAHVGVHLIVARRTTHPNLASHAANPCLASHQRHLHVGQSAGLLCRRRGGACAATGGGRAAAGRTRSCCGRRDARQARRAPRLGRAWRWRRKRCE